VKSGALCRLLKEPIGMATRVKELVTRGVRIVSGDAWLPKLPDAAVASDESLGEK